MKKIEKILNRIYDNEELRGTIVPLFISNPGLGKTVLIEKFAKERGVTLVEIITSQVSPYEVSGLAMPDKLTKKMMYYDFDRIENLKDGDILFFDELLQGNPVVLASCLTLIEGRKTISGKKLPKILIVAAANPQSMVPLSPAIKERFIWYDVSFDSKMWIDYMIEKYSITKSIGNKLSLLIKEEKFISNNFFTPRSIDKSVNMILNGVPTPYSSTVLPILSELVTNKLDEPIRLSDKKQLDPKEMISWIKLIKYKRKYNEIIN